MFLLTRLFAVFTAALFSVGVAKAGSEVSPQAVVTDPPPTTIAEPFGNPLIIQDLNADWSSSEEWIPQVPDLPAGITLEPAKTPEPVSSTEINGGTPETTVPLPEWTGRIPEIYGDGSGCTREEASIIARELWARGATDDTVYKMLKIISRESLCDPSAHNGNRNTGDDSWGLCQQNNLSGWFDEGKLLENYDRFAFAGDFALNAESCAVMWAECSVGPWNYGNYYCSTPRELR